MGVSGEERERAERLFEEWSKNKKTKTKNSPNVMKDMNI